MRLDQGSLIFTPQNGECPSWETALGQSREPRDDMPPYYFKAEGYENMLKGMYFNSVPLAKTSCILGKKKLFVTASESYLNPEYQEIQLASKFDNVIVHFQNNAKIFRNTPIILLLTKIQDVNKSHYRRRSIKYSPHTTYDTIKNQESFEEIQRHYQERLMCYGFFIEHFDTLHLYCVSVDDNSYTYSNLSLPQTEWTDWADWELKEREKIQNKTPTISSEKDNQEKENNVSFTPSQIIYYGVPGCGKSHEIKKKLKNVPDYNKIRTVFHPEYSNADFVGQILPEVNIDTNGRSIVEYKFKPGPFTEIVRRAYLNPDESFYLVIEEINRGNAAAIFGEMFQLLDRLDADENADEVSSEHIYGKGWSSYGVDNQDVNAYIRNQVVISQEKPEHCSNVTGSAGDLNPRLYKSMDIESENVTVTWREKNENGFTPKSKHIHFTANTAIRLPPNLSIYATMNSSDQNVFTLDNAFQRRWEMKQIPNELKDKVPANASEEEKKNIQAEIDQYNKTIECTNVQWGDFRKAINEVIMDSAQANGLSSMEDKRLGGWFYTESDNFAEKVLKYLWDDAFKFDRKTQFGEIKTLEDLVKEFNKVGFKVFKADAISKLQRDSLTTPDTPAQNDTSVTNG
ncbi:AAA family ATPase [uncultured Fibrobacter sp.]|uniref:AAA family ATPase n=1 Tax=uncultured Fibrobacter sp. TaxID=261512 RepID=UPI0025F034A7|nr:AAA family ATPase [uncultured Fibrobacter sp.]